MTTQFIFIGSDGTNFGHYGVLDKGDVIDVPDSELADADASSNLRRKPVVIPNAFPPAQLNVTATTTLSANDTGKVVALNCQDVSTVTLPASPTAGLTYRFICGPLQVGDATIDPGAKEIDGESSATVSPPNGALTIQYNGTEWVSS